jgi:hypothetical protein
MGRLHLYRLFGTFGDVGCLFGTFSDVGGLVMGRFESGTFRAAGPWVSGTFSDGTFCMCTV